MLKGLFPGTFDPPTLGHLQLIRRAAALLDHLIVAIGENPEKKDSILKTEEKIEILQKETKTLRNVEVVSYRGLTVALAKKEQATVLIRGLRSAGDLEAEKQMENANRKMGIETLFLFAESEMATISSSLIRQLAAHGAPLQEYLPEGLEALLHTRLKERT